MTALAVQPVEAQITSIPYPFRAIEDDAQERALVETPTSDLVALGLMLGLAVLSLVLFGGLVLVLSLVLGAVGVDDAVAWAYGVVLVASLAGYGLFMRVAK